MVIFDEYNAKSFLKLVFLFMYSELWRENCDGCGYSQWMDARNSIMVWESIERKEI